MKYTEAYSLKKPESDDFYNVEDFNYNVDIIEEELKDRLSLSKGGYITGTVNFGEEGDEIGWIGEKDGNLMVSSTDITLIRDCSSNRYYYTSRNGYDFVNIENVFKPAEITVAAYLSDEKYKEGADYVSTTETGDKAALIKAVEACPEGGTVRLLPGEYVIVRDLLDGAETASIEIDKGITLTGGNPSAVILRQEGELNKPTIIFKAAAENVTIENMTLLMEPDSYEETTFLICIMASYASVRGCIFKSQENLSVADSSIQFYYREGITTVNPDDSTGYIVEGVIIEGCRFNIDYASLAPGEVYGNEKDSCYCDILRSENVKVSGRIYGNTSSKGFIAVYNNLDSLAYNNDLVIFGNGAVRVGSFYGDEIRSYGT